MQPISICILREWQPLSIRICDHALTRKICCNNILNTINGYLPKCFFDPLQFTSFHHLLLGVSTDSFKKKQRNKRQTKQNNPTIRQPLMEKLLERVFALSHGQMFSSTRQLELDDKLWALNVTPYHSGSNKNGSSIKKAVCKLCSLVISSN